MSRRHTALVAACLLALPACATTAQPPQETLSQCTGHLRIVRGDGQVVPARPASQAASADPWTDPLGQAVHQVGPGQTPSTTRDAAWVDKSAVIKTALVASLTRPPFAGVSWLRSHDRIDDNTSHLGVVAGDDTTFTLSTSRPDLGLFPRGPLVVVDAADGEVRYSVEPQVGRIGLVRSDGDRGAVYAVSSDGASRLVRVNHDGSEVLWCRALRPDTTYAASDESARGETMGAPLSLDGGSTLVIAVWRQEANEVRKRQLVALNAWTGEPTWTIDAPNPGWTPGPDDARMVALGDLVLISQRSVSARDDFRGPRNQLTQGSDVVAVHGDSGTEAWRLRLDAVTVASPDSAPSSGEPAAPDSEVARPWRTTVLGAARHTAIVWAVHEDPESATHGRVAELLGVDPDGEIVWRTPANPWLTDIRANFSALITPDLVLTPAPESRPGDPARVQALDPATGAVRWTADMPTGETAHPRWRAAITSGGYAIAPVSDGRLLVTDLATGDAEVIGQTGDQRLGVRRLVTSGQRRGDGMLALATSHGLFAVRLR